MDEEAKPRGSGLGPSVAKNIADMHAIKIGLGVPLSGSGLIVSLIFGESQRRHLTASFLARQFLTFAIRRAGGREILKRKTKKALISQSLFYLGVPKGIRTPVLTVKG